MNQDDRRTQPRPEEVQSGLAGLAEAGAPAGFALRVLAQAGISPQRYDTYVHLEIASGGLYTAFSEEAVTGAVLESTELTATAFEELHRTRTGRSAIPATVAFTGLRTAVRTGRTRQLPLDIGHLPKADRAVLEAVRTIPAGQLRPLSWITREASLGARPAAGWAVEILARNPMAYLIPCHRVTHEDGAPCDAGHPREAGDALRQAEGIDRETVREWSGGAAVFLGSDTTHIFCHPTCAHARRITPPHQVRFPTARAAHRAGYRACKSCRPVSV
ncbi:MULTISPECIES: Ada metal-binding domain-containing protein [unclassified Streptomyces]|uniref:Ada metal-binding domain-containing protein n=1 Tax=unclassified Streptomyces TaxID=2593676 RepID=UPI002DDBEA98|nr:MULTISPECIES: Ada metal-binding domain-containing protein [unclassified Streptomyces]WSA94884.1 MGMT family protein [Streptomyces sp. NBC_01795]WSB79304.1 MGMT family protein [Streptomyces sp. NBC_01775]WSS12492.1 MGMT family protein [Streptomyces sp. NBC_01186]WSS41278.1 MGMT family protein [Streptomyces sp. NBC_01187]